MENSDDIKYDNISRYRSRERMWLQLELFLWVFIGFIISGRFWVDIFRYLGPKVSLGDIISERYLEVLIGLLVMVFPLIFQIV